jgi:hypothetical protein
MKKLTAVIIGIALTASLYSHPATEITAKFNAPTKSLILTYLHAVKDNADHYISEVKIELNGKLIITQSLSKQENNISGDLMFKIPEAKEGDKITIKTKCNKIGTKDYTLTVSGKEALKKEVPQDAPKEPAPVKKAPTDLKAPAIPK